MITDNIQNWALQNDRQIFVFRSLCIDNSADRKKVK